MFRVGISVLAGVCHFLLINRKFTDIMRSEFPFIRVHSLLLKQHTYRVCVKAIDWVMLHGSGSQTQVAIQVMVARGFCGELNNYEKKIKICIKLKKNDQENVIIEFLFIKCKQNGAIKF